MNLSSHWMARVGVALAVALPAILSSRLNATAAPPRATSQPTLRLNYFAGSAGLLAGTLDPAQAPGEQDVELGMMLNAGLVAVGTNDRVVPRLATSWKISKDGKTYTFFMRHNARFANGDPVTASDVVYSIRRALAPSTNSTVAYYDSLIKGYDAYNGGKSTSLGVKALNKYTVQVKIIHAAAYFLFSFTSPINDALDPKVVQGHVAGPNNNYLTTTCAANQGAGPFKFVCRNNSSDPSSFYPSGQSPSYTLVPNKYYWGKPAKIKVILPSSGSADQYYNQYLAGSAEMTFIPSADLQSWLSKKTPQLRKAATSIIDYIIVGNKVPPFDNINCRRAFAYGVDRPAIAAILHNTVKPLYTLVPKGFIGWWNGSGVPHYDLKKAQAYLAKCPGRDMPVTYMYQATSTDAANVAAAIGNMLQQVGFKASIKGITDNSIASHPFSENHIQAIRNGWAQDYPDPQDYTSLLLQCGVPYNTGQYCDPKFDQLTKKADVEQNSKLRAKLYIEAQKVALNDVANIPYDNRVEYELIKPYVHGLVLTIAYVDFMPKNLDWSTVSISKH